MKRLFLALILTAMTSYISSALSYRGFGDFGIGYYFGIGYDGHDSDNIYLGASTSHGMQFNHHLFIGLGLGWEREMLYGDYRGRWRVSSDAKIIRIFSDVRYDLDISKRWSPFVDLKVGYCNVVGENYYEFEDYDYNYNTYNHEYYKYNSGIMIPITFNPTIGIRFKLSRVCGLNFGIGYSPHFLKWKYFDTSERRDVTEKLTAHAVYFNLGVDF